MIKKLRKKDLDPATFNENKGLAAPPEKVPEIKIQPPMIFGFFVLVSLLLNYFLLEIKLDIFFNFYPGFVISILGIAINMWSMNRYRYHCAPSRRSL